MRIIADFHLHSKYSRATSRDMIPETISRWAKWKGIDLIGTGDFTHPLWFSELKQKLTPAEEGLYRLKDDSQSKIRYILTAEISCIYSDGNKVRKVHLVFFAPSFETVEKINAKLSTIGNLYSDGRPIIGISSYDLAKLVFSIDPTCLVIPAHAWTPWFSIFGSKSGFDAIEECFRDLTDQIYALETGLSSDPEMNWRLSKLDPISLISCSDAHSPANLGREATVFYIEDEKDLTYTKIVEMIKNSRKKDYSAQKDKLDYTVEFFPEEGMYHFDGHRVCDATRLDPQESKKIGNICPVCKKPLTIGVMHRVDDLADRQEDYIPQNFPGSKHLIPLQEIIAESMGVQKGSVRVQEEYQKMVHIFGSEFAILLDIPVEEISKNYNPKISEGIKIMREGKVTKIPGYDGVYGAIKVFDKEREEKLESRQSTLF